MEAWPRDGPLPSPAVNLPGSPHPCASTTASFSLYPDTLSTAAASLAHQRPPQRPSCGPGPQPQDPASDQPELGAGSNWPRQGIIARTSLWNTCLYATAISPTERPPSVVTPFPTVGIACTPHRGPASQLVRVGSVRAPPSPRMRHLEPSLCPSHGRLGGCVCATEAAAVSRSPRSSRVNLLTPRHAASRPRLRPCPQHSEGTLQDGRVAAAGLGASAALWPLQAGHGGRR